MQKSIFSCKCESEIFPWVGSLIFLICLRELCLLIFFLSIVIVPMFMHVHISGIRVRDHDFSEGTVMQGLAGSCHNKKFQHSNLTGSRGLVGLEFERACI